MALSYEEVVTSSHNPNGWCCSGERLPRPKSRIIATNKKVDQDDDDWSGYPKLIGALYFTGDVFLNEHGIAFSIEAFKSKTADWVYAPPGYELPFEYRNDDPIKF